MRVFLHLHWGPAADYLYDAYFYVMLPMISMYLNMISILHEYVVILQCSEHLQNMVGTKVDGPMGRWPMGRWPID